MGAYHTSSIPNDGLRAAFEASGLTLTGLARRAGTDHTTIARALGFQRDAHKGIYRTHLRMPLAQKILAALGLDPVDVDL